MYICVLCNGKVCCLFALNIQYLMVRLIALMDLNKAWPNFGLCTVKTE